MIKGFPVYTEAEKNQVDEGRTCIKLSKGQPIYPRNFKKRRDTFAGACLYLAMSMAINGGIILSEQDLLDALIL